MANPDLTAIEKALAAGMLDDLYIDRFDGAHGDMSFHLVSGSDTVAIVPEDTYPEGKWLLARVNAEALVALVNAAPRLLEIARAVLEIARAAKEVAALVTKLHESEGTRPECGDGLRWAEEQLRAAVEGT